MSDEEADQSPRPASPPPELLPPDDDRAIIRDNRPLGYPTLSLLVCAASVGLDGIDVSYAELPAPGEWGHLDLHAPRS